VVIVIIVIIIIRVVIVIIVIIIIITITIINNNNFNRFRTLKAGFFTLHCSSLLKYDTEAYNVQHFI